MGTGFSQQCGNSNKQSFNSFKLYRHQEDGVQEPTVAREMLQLPGVQDGHWHQVVHPAGAGHLLQRLLRREVRHALRQVHQGSIQLKHIFINYLSFSYSFNYLINSFNYLIIHSII